MESVVLEIFRVPLRWRNRPPALIFERLFTILPAHHFGIFVPESCDVAYCELTDAAQLVLANTSLLRRTNNPGVTRIPLVTLPNDPTSLSDWNEEFARTQIEAGQVFSHIHLGHLYLESKDYEKAK
jgi:hypothetical protein